MRLRPDVLFSPAWAIAVTLCCTVGAGRLPAAAPVPLIFDTDMGNDVDDALALAVIHALQTRDECELLAVTVSKDNPYSAAFCDLVNTFYGRGDVPVGIVHDGKTPKDSPFTKETVLADEGSQKRYPHDVRVGKPIPVATAVLRKTLAAQPDASVVIVVVGFSTNLARLLDSPADEASPLTGRQLVAKKCRLLSMMAGMFGPKPRKEYNVYMDVEAARKVFEEWPTPIVVSGYEIGLAIRYPAESIQNDFGYVRHHPIREAYELYKEMPYDRPSWDLTAVLYAVRPERGYFGLSPAGKITVDEDAVTLFTPDSSGNRRYLTATPDQIVRVREALTHLASQPPAPAKPE